MSTVTPGRPAQVDNSNAVPAQVGTANRQSSRLTTTAGTIVFKATGVASPFSATRSRQRRQMGSKGWSLMSQPSTTGSSGSRNPTSERMSRDLACPRSPRRIRSWPEMMALATCGSTVSS